MTISLPFSAAVVYVVQKVYLRTSRQLRFLELESRSAVYSSFLETVGAFFTAEFFCLFSFSATLILMHLPDPGYRNNQSLWLAKTNRQSKHRDT